MKHYSISILLVLLMSMASTKAFAYDIAVENEDGVTIYYNYINNYTELEVTAKEIKEISDYYESWGYEGVKTLKIPAEVTYSGRMRKVTRIGANAFCGMELYNNGDHSWTEYRGAFIECIYLPSTITSIGENAFRYYYSKVWSQTGSKNRPTKLKKVVINDLKSFLEISGKHNLYSANQGFTPVGYNNLGYDLCLNNENNVITDIDVPAGIKDLYGLRACKSIERLTIGNDVETVREWEGCTNLKKVDLQGLNNTEMMYEAFYLCKIDTLIIGSNLKKLGGSVFGGSVENYVIKDLDSWLNMEVGYGSQNCAFGTKRYDTGTNSNHYQIIGRFHILDDEGREIDNLVVPDGITVVNPFAFNNLACVKKITTPANVEFSQSKIYGEGVLTGTFQLCEDLESVVIDGIEEIHSKMFMGCSKLKNISWGNCIKTIGFFAFLNCGMTKLSLPEGVNIIGDECFYNCPLKSVVIPSSVTSIGERAFYTDELTTVIPLFVENIPDAGTSNYNAFSYNTLINNATLYVPEGTVDKYKSTIGWKDFVWIEEGTPSGIAGVKTNDGKTEVSRYTLDGKKLYEPQKGINIIKMSDGTTKKEIVK